MKIPRVKRYSNKQPLFFIFWRGVIQWIVFAPLVYIWTTNVILSKKPGRIHLKKSGTRVPRVELEEVGPSADLVLRRTKIASDDLYRRAKKQPYAAKVWSYVCIKLLFIHLLWNNPLQQSLMVPFQLRYLWYLYFRFSVFLHFRVSVY